MELRRTPEQTFYDATVAELLLILGIMLIPYDAFRLMPSEYRPIAIFPLLVSLIFVFGRREVALMSKSRVLLLLFAIVATFSTFLLTSQTNYGVDRVPSFVLTLSIGVLLFFAFSILFVLMLRKLGVNGFLDWLFTWLSRAYILPIAIGAIEALSLLGVFPSSISASLSHFFGSNQEGRLTLTTYEASWAAFHLLIAGFSFYYRYKSTSNVFHGACFLTSLGLFLFSQSMQGFIVATVAAIIFVIWLSYKQNNLLTLIKWVSLTVLCIFLLVIILKIIYTNQGQDTYYTRRLLGFEGVESLIKSDGSSFVRIMFPVMGMQMFFDHLLTGIGGGMFASYLPEYIFAYYPWAVSFGEIAQDLAGELVPSAVCLYSKIFAEQGIIGVSLFGAYFACVCHGFDSLGDVGNWKVRIAAFFLITLICMPFQFASYAFLPLWLALGVLDALCSYQTELDGLMGHSSE